MTMGLNCLRWALLFSSALLAIAKSEYKFSTSQIYTELLLIEASIDSKPRQTIISFGV
jgi:hypothetical protein